MDWPIYLRRKDLPAFSGLSLDACLKVLERQGVKPVDIGGKHYGLRYYRDAVQDALRTLHAEAQAAPPARHVRRKSALRIVGKSASDLFEELRKGA